MRQRVSIREVAEEAGVSTALVSLALNRRPGVAPSTRSRIIEVADRLGYQVHPVARTLRTGRSNAFGLLIRNFTNAFFVDVVAGAQRRARTVGATMLAIDSDYSAEAELDHIRWLAGQDVDGLAIAPVGSGDSITLWQELRPGAPTVVVNAVAPGIQGVMHVSPDNAAAVELALRHLIERGHHCIAFLTATRTLMADHDRMETFERLASDYGVRPLAVETALNLDAVEGAVRDVLDQRDAPTAVVANSDFTAHAVYKAVRRRRLRVGRDVAVIGHDDLPTSALLDPPLTTIRLDRRALGVAVFDRLIGIADGDYRSQVELVVRGSG